MDRGKLPLQPNYESKYLVARFYWEHARAYNDGLSPIQSATREESMDLMEIEDLGTIVTVWSIRLAMGCMFAAFCLLLTDRRHKNLSSDEVGDSVQLVGASHLWLLGSFFSLIHAMAAMIFTHQGSHELAFADIAEKTQATIGVAIGAGIYFNYAFVIVWLADAMWWIAKPKSYQSRIRVWNWLVYGFLIFIAINGTIVFETGIVRWISIAGLAGLAILAYLKFQTKR